MNRQLLDGLQKMDDSLMERHRSWKTRKAYKNAILRYAKWLKSHPQLATQTSEQKVEAYLTMLARKGCAASSQNVQFSALLYFYERGLGRKLKSVDALRAKRPVRVRRCPPVQEVHAVLSCVENLYGYNCKLILEWIYGNGLRVSEPLNARIKDFDFESQQFTVRDGKHSTDRVVKIPPQLIEAIQQQMKFALMVWAQDKINGIPVPLPGRLAVKYPSAQFSRAWAWLFPAKSPCEFDGKIYRYRVHESVIQRAMKAAVRKADVCEDITPHSLRHAYATHTIHMGGAIHDLQAALGHRQIQTTAGYTHAEIARLPCPLDCEPSKVVPFVAPFADAEALAKEAKCLK